MTGQEAMKAAAQFRAQRRKLFGDRVMLIRDESQTHFGLVELPDQLRKQSGTIVMIGVDVDLTKHDVKIGDRVLFTKWSPAEIVLELPDGSEVGVIIFHIHDLYVGTDSPELTAQFAQECAALELGPNDFEPFSITK
jgi:co-chaperonin GroES (HSP10)